MGEFYSNHYHYYYIIILFSSGLFFFPFEYYDFVITFLIFWRGPGEGSECKKGSREKWRVFLYTSYSFSFIYFFPLTALGRDN